MHIPKSRLAGALLAFGVLVPLSARAQSGLIDCSASGNPPDCRVPLKATDRSATIMFRLTNPNLSEAPKILIAPLGTGDAAVQITEGASRTYTYPWKSDTVIRSTVRLLVQTVPTAVVPLQSDTIYLVPPQATPIDVVVRRYAPYAGLKDTWLPMVITPQFEHQNQSQLTEAECAKVRFKAQAGAAGTVAPDSGRGQWDAANHRCVGETRWRLGPATGTQQLRFDIGDDKDVAQSHGMLRAFSREGPRVIGGVGYFNRYSATRTFYCPVKRPSNPATECAREEPNALTADTFQVKRRERRDNEVRPFAGIEVPIVLSHQPANSVGQFFARRVRLLAGTGIDEPGENMFVGATISALFFPEYESSLVQLQGGWQFRRGGYFIGASIDASSLLSAALKSLGSPL